MDKRIIGVYQTEDQALAAVEDLKREGYRSENISIIAKNTDRLGPAADELKPKQTDGLITGATTGAALGLTGLFVGMSTLAIPGIGLILAAGPIFATLGGAVAGLAADAGGLRRALEELGLEKEEARRFEDDVKRGNILVFVSE
ncbi:general stress protein [Bacillus sp. T33-2]|uniref:general stress protein n=1 Tax=Bacillus sp. T33-2 TaxID=2054168 RepID=UPI00215518E4|nr:general stress protein [Bacillus sp. T33-2]